MVFSPPNPTAPRRRPPSPAPRLPPSPGPLPGMPRRPPATESWGACAKLDSMERAEVGMPRCKVLWGCGACGRREGTRGRELTACRGWLGAARTRPVLSRVSWEEPTQRRALRPAGRPSGRCRGRSRRTRSRPWPCAAHGSAACRSEAARSQRRDGLPRRTARDRRGRDSQGKAGRGGSSSYTLLALRDGSRDPG